MSWASHRIEEYQQGKPSTWLERRMLEHANLLHFVVAVIAGLGFVYGVWMHDWVWIVCSSLLALSGHIYCAVWIPPQSRVLSTTACSDRAVCVEATAGSLSPVREQPNDQLP